MTSATPSGRHRWIVAANTTNGTIAIDHTIRAVTHPLITSPSFWDTVNHASLTITWTTSSDTGATLILLIGGISTSDTPSTSTSVLVLPIADNGSYTLSKTDLSGIPRVGQIHTSLLRVSSDLITMNAKYYLFVNGSEDDIICNLI